MPTLNYIQPSILRTYNKTQISIIANILNLLIHTVVCDKVDYACDHITSNGKSGTNARCYVSFEGINKPRLLIEVQRSGVTRIYEERAEWELIESYV